VPPSQRLDVTDAKNVQVIYTTRYLIGVGIEIGHENFYPNNGKHVQPGCRFPKFLYGLSPGKRI
jgi:hypothetical protein